MWVLFLSLGLLASANEIASRLTDRAHVIVHKRLATLSVPPGADILVKGKPFTVSYTVHNWGTEPAFNVSVQDMFPQKSFDMSAKAGGFVVSDRGTVQLVLPMLAPGANVTHVLTLVPKDSGRMSVGHAVVKYRWLASPELESEEEGGEGAAAQVTETANSMSSSQGKIEIVEPDVYERLSKERGPVAMGVSVVAALLLIVCPYMMMNAAKNKEGKGK